MRTAIDLLLQAVKAFAARELPETTRDVLDCKVEFLAVSICAFSFGFGLSVAAIEPVVAELFGGGECWRGVIPTFAIVVEAPCRNQRHEAQSGDGEKCGDLHGGS